MNNYDRIKFLTGFFSTIARDKILGDQGLGMLNALVCGDRFILIAVGEAANSPVAKDKLSMMLKHLAKTLEADAFVIASEVWLVTQTVLENTNKPIQGSLESVPGRIEAIYINVETLERTGSAAFELRRNEKGIVVGWNELKELNTNQERNSELRSEGRFVNIITNDALKSDVPNSVHQTMKAMANNLRSRMVTFDEFINETSAQNALSAH